MQGYPCPPGNVISAPKVRSLITDIRFNSDESPTVKPNKHRRFKNINHLNMFISPSENSESIMISRPQMIQPNRTVEMLVSFGWFLA